VASQASRDLQALAAIPGKLEVGPHASALIDELVQAVRAGHHLSVIILAAALVDILTHEAVDGFADIYDDVDGEEEEEEGIGLSMLRAGERRALDQLRAMRNRILHYQGPSEGLSGHSSDPLYRQGQAEAAIRALLPLLELQEIY
jgi:hypothetical protein